jgi:AraC-like DNA-binding protein
MLEHFLIASIYAAALVMLLVPVLLYCNRKGGDRARMILAGTIFISVFNYVPKIVIWARVGFTDSQVISVPMLALALFMILTYLIYPVEVISPGWLNFKRLLKLYSPVAGIMVLYWIALACGIKFRIYANVLEMMRFAGDFDAMVRLMLCMVLCVPIVIIFFIPYTRIYSNADKTWVRVYVVSYVIDVLSYLLLLTFHSVAMTIIYFHTTILITLVRAYMDLYYRLVDKNVSGEMLMAKSLTVMDTRKTAIEMPDCDKCKTILALLQDYMAEKQAWRDPNMSLTMLAEKLHTNRTTLSDAIRKGGAESFPAYINHLRIIDFIALKKSCHGMRVKDAFYICGYRSMVTALRNFKNETGTTPGEYFSADDTE